MKWSNQKRNTMMMKLWIRIYKIGPNKHCSDIELILQKCILERMEATLSESSKGSSNAKWQSIQKSTLFKIEELNRLKRTINLKLLKTRPILKLLLKQLLKKKFIQMKKTMRRRNRSQR